MDPVTVAFVDRRNHLDYGRDGSGILRPCVWVLERYQCSTLASITRIQEEQEAISQVSSATVMLVVC